MRKILSNLSPQIPFNTTVIFFFLASLLGISLRLIHVGFLPLNFKHYLHTHSHIALLGWLFNISLLVIQYVLNSKPTKSYQTLFWLCQLTFLGMLFSFPFQGYGFFSIMFSTLYLFCTYYLSYLLLQHAKTHANSSISTVYRYSAIYLIFSSFGPYALGFIMAKQLQDSFWYPLSIYWFLHFLYNGFFLLVTWGFILTKLPQSKLLSKATKWMCFSILPSFALSVLWLSPSVEWYVLAFIGSAIQAFTFLVIWKIKDSKPWFNHPWAMQIFKIAILAYFLKITFQLLAVFPWVQNYLMDTVNTSIIGFIHLVMLGFFTLFFLAIAIEKNWIPTNIVTKWGLLLLIIGIISSELLLFLESILNYFFHTSIPLYMYCILGVSLLMPIGIGLILVTVLKSFRQFNHALN